ncbi:hypothetical protein ACGF7U_22215 [Micromonospora sp. NPDC047670]|uniref:hypothetical protein n=1 Tax=Micromonospora sp. NPDC047670 TaxID=3364252 RepID=UPI003712A025
MGKGQAGLLTDTGLVSLAGWDGDRGRYTTAVTVSDDGRVIGGQLHVEPEIGGGPASLAVRWRCR